MQPQTGPFTKNIWRIALPIVLVLLGLWSAAAPLHAAVLPIIISLSPITQTIPLNGTTTVDILFTDPNPVPVVNLYGADVRLTFDATRLQVQDDDTGKTGIQITPGPLLKSPDGFFIVLNTANNTPPSGTISFAITELSPANPVAANGVLATISFKGIAIGSAPINFSSHKLSDRNGFEIPSTSADGFIIVGTPTADAITSFQAAATAPTKVHATWSAAYAPGASGFNLWRRSAGHGDYARVNSDPIPIQDPGSVATVQYSYDDTTASPATAYDYKLELLLVSGNSIWAGPVGVNTATACAGALAAPTFVAPAAGHSFNTRRAKLDWSDVPCATKYQIQLRHASPQGARVLKQKTTASEFTTPPLATDSVYVWRVRVKNSAAAHSVWTKWRSFRIRPTAASATWVISVFGLNSWWSSVLE